MTFHQHPPSFWKAWWRTVHRYASCSNSFVSRDSGLTKAAKGLLICWSVAYVKGTNTGNQRHRKKKSYNSKGHTCLICAWCNPSSTSEEDKHCLCCVTFLLPIPPASAEILRNSPSNQFGKNSLANRQLTTKSGIVAAVAVFGSVFIKWTTRPLSRGGCRKEVQRVSKSYMYFVEGSITCNFYSGPYSACFSSVEIFKVCFFATTSEMYRLNASQACLIWTGRRKVQLTGDANKVRIIISAYQC